MKIILVLLCMMLAGFKAAAVDSPSVPNNIQFAGLDLKLSDRARKKIQAEVDALTRYPKYYQIKVDRLQIYFPIIERVFSEEGLPEDFKYLVLQESGLISDAVSSSNAVGFWQFKTAAATEVGLRVDRNVDERLNIVASTRGAAKYIKKNNRLYFDNWVHALLAYQQGPGGAQRLVKKKYQGSRSMPIDGDTHWYVIKFLAHKIAFEQVKTAQPKLHLVEYYEGQGKTIKEIAHQHKLDQNLVQQYNKWLKHGKVPGDKAYAVILPYDRKPVMLASGKQVQSTGVSAQPVSSRYETHPTKYPEIKTFRNGSKGIKINGIKGVRLTRDMDLRELEENTGVSTRRLLYYNDVKANKKPRAGELWYLRSKRSKAREQYHIVTSGEDLWTISQKYGIRLKKLRKKNHISKRQTTVEPGRVLWLQSTRPNDVPVAYMTSGDSERDPPSRYLTQTATGKGSPEDSKDNNNDSAITTELTREKPSEQMEAPLEATEMNQSKSTKSAEMVHVVQSGETLYSISKKYQVSVDDISNWNDLDNASVLGIGDQLIIYPADKQANSQSLPNGAIEAEFELYRVRTGDTLYQIARDHSTTIKELMEWNQKSDFNLRIGEELKVRKLP